MPSSVPFIITGLRIGAGRALVGVIVAEFIAANIGIGFYISLNGNLLNASRVMLGVLIIGAFGVFVGDRDRPPAAVLRSVATGDPLTGPSVGPGCGAPPCGPGWRRALWHGAAVSASGRAPVVRPIAGFALAELAADEHRDPAVVTRQLDDRPLGVARPDRLEELLVDRR